MTPAERQVGGDDHRGLLIELADQVEQQLPARAGARQGLNRPGIAGGPNS